MNLGPEEMGDDAHGYGWVAKYTDRIAAAARKAA
jgi:hypothetical protein